MESDAVARPGGPAKSTCVGWLVVAAVLACMDVADAITVDKLLGGGRLVAYAPRGYDPASTRPASARALRADAESLAAVGFTAVTTYGSSRALVPVCRFFKRRGFKTVLVGVWDPRDRAELRRAIRLKRCADGYVVGNEGLTFGRYSRDELAAAIERVRRATGRPVTTRETLKAYADYPSLLRLGDWIFPTIHPWYAEQRGSQEACGWTIFAYHDLAERAPAGRPTVIAETGLPTEGAPSASEHYQRAFFLCVESRQVAFAHFEAFDQPWKRDDAVAPHWGLFRADGTPKLWAAQQLVPTLAVERTNGMLRGRVSGGVSRTMKVVAYVRSDRWTALPPVVPDRHGGWLMAVPADKPVAVYVVSTAWRPPATVERLPRVDRAQVLVARELPAM
jgi:exo-beta-1,3-glucanase (GH17 family)